MVGILKDLPLAFACIPKCYRAISNGPTPVRFFVLKSTTWHGPKKPRRMVIFSYTYTRLDAAVLFHHRCPLTPAETLENQWISWRLKTGEPPDHEGEFTKIVIAGFDRVLAIPKVSSTIDIKSRIGLSCWNFRCLPWKLLHMSVSQNRGTPKSSIKKYIGVPLFSPSILGVSPYFWKHPYTQI